MDWEEGIRKLREEIAQREVREGLCECCYADCPNAGENEANEPPILECPDFQGET